MKKLLFIFLSILITFTACKKYQDGPSFTLYPKKYRLARGWVIDKVFENGVDKTTEYKNLYCNFSWYIDKLQNYILSYTAYNTLPYSEMGTWKFSNNKTHLLFSNNDVNALPTISNDWTIYRLTVKEFWIETTNSLGVNVEMHLTH
ncbi:MAG: hypothetical protein NT084_03870 [Bacteroidetes bacterium]|nr:hypothetical protein [Bacteroidota bacterium]